MSGGQALSVTGNASNGFVIYIAGTQAVQNLRNARHNWTDVTGTYASPAVLGAGERFGYTYKDSTSASSVTNPGSANFIALTNTANAVMGSATSESGSGASASTQSPVPRHLQAPTRPRSSTQRFRTFNAITIDRWGHRPSVRSYRAALLLVLTLWPLASPGVVTTPTPASALTTATQVAAGGRTTCAVMTGGNAYCWGDNTYGQLGNGTTTSSSTPVLVLAATHGRASPPTTTTRGDGIATTCGVTTSGAGTAGEAIVTANVGDGTTHSGRRQLLVSGSYTWASISSVGQTPVVSQQLAPDTAGVSTAMARSETAPPPKKHSDGRFWWIHVGEHFRRQFSTCGVTTSGVGYCWGQNSTGEVGRRHDIATYDSPRPFLAGYTWSLLSR